MHTTMTVWWNSEGHKHDPDIKKCYGSLSKNKNLNNKNKINIEKSNNKKSFKFQ